jgi:hypothetical protein
VWNWKNLPTIRPSIIGVKPEGPFKPESTDTKDLPLPLETPAPGYIKKQESFPATGATPVFLCVIVPVLPVYIRHGWNTSEIKR